MMRLLFIALIFLAFNSNAENHKFKLKCKVGGLKNDKAVLLRYGTPVSDTVIVKNGVCEISKASIQEGQYVVSFVNSRLYLPLVLENGKLEAIASRYEIDGRYIQKYRMKGSQTYDLQREYGDMYAKTVQTYPKELQKIYYKFTKKYWDGNKTPKVVALRKQWKDATTDFNDRLLQNQFEFIKKHADKYVAITLLNRNPHLTKEHQSEIIAKLPKKYHSYPGLKRFAVEMENVKKSTVGGQAHDFTLEDVNGKKYSLKDYRGKYVLLDFWASWCGPCIKMMPHLKEVKAKYKNKDFEIISISADNVRKNWVRKLNSIKMTWPSLINDGVGAPGAKTIVDKYTANSLPTMIIVDKSGKIIFRGIGGDAVDALDAKLKEILE